MSTSRTEAGVCGSSASEDWIDALVHAGGYGMIMGYQFYPWTHGELAGEIREKLKLPVDTPRRIEVGTMQRFENWVQRPKVGERTTARVERLLARFEAGKREPEAT